MKKLIQKWLGIIEFIDDTNDKFVITSKVVQNVIDLKKEIKELDIQGRYQKLLDYNHYTIQALNALGDKIDDLTKKLNKK